MPTTGGSSVMWLRAADTWCISSDPSSVAARRRAPPTDCTPTVPHTRCMGDEGAGGCGGTRGEREYALGRAEWAWGRKELEEGLLSELWSTLMSIHCASMR